MAWRRFDDRQSIQVALALHWGMDIQASTLSETDAEATFAFVAALSYMPEEQEHMYFDERNDEEDNSDEGVLFSWEERPEELQQELLILWKRYGEKSTNKFEVKPLLEQAVRYAGLPSRAAENNLLAKYEQHGAAGKFDKLSKTQQQMLFNSLRMQAKLYGLLC